MRRNTDKFVSLWRMVQKSTFLALCLTMVIAGVAAVAGQVDVDLFLPGGDIGATVINVGAVVVFAMALSLIVEAGFLFASGIASAETDDGDRR